MFLKTETIENGTNLYFATPFAKKEDLSVIHQEGVLTVTINTDFNQPSLPFTANVLDGCTVTAEHQTNLLIVKVRKPDPKSYAVEIK